MLLQNETIRAHLTSPVALHLYDSIDSTNNEAKRQALTDGAHLYASTHQTAGRGRRGHDFYSPKDTGLYMTLSLPVDRVEADIQKLTCIAAVAVCEAITSLSPEKPLIKWVNDVYIDGKKVAGILTELLTDEHNRPTAAIVGIGLNLTTAHFPEAFAKTAGAIGDIEPNALCAAIVNRLVALSHRKDNSFIEIYKTLNYCLGRTVTYVKDGVTHSAKAVDIADDGGLVVEENSVCTTLNSGEISITPQR